MCDHESIKHSSSVCLSVFKPNDHTFPPPVSPGSGLQVGGFAGHRRIAGQHFRRSARPGGGAQSRRGGRRSWGRPGIRGGQHGPKTTQGPIGPDDETTDSAPTRRGVGQRQVTSVHPYHNADQSEVQNWPHAETEQTSCPVTAFLWSFCQGIDPTLLINLWSRPITTLWRKNRQPTVLLGLAVCTLYCIAMTVFVHKHQSAFEHYNVPCIVHNAAASSKTFFSRDRTPVREWKMASDSSFL